MNLDRTPEERHARVYPNGIHLFDFNATVDSLRGEVEYRTNGRNGVVLVKQEYLRVVLEVLRAGAGLPEHPMPGAITLQVIEGKLRFEAGAEIVYLRRGEILSTGPGSRSPWKRCMTARSC